MRHEGVGGDGAETAGLEVLQRLADLRFGVHHEGPVVLDRLFDGAPPQHEQLEIGGARVLSVVGPEGHPVTAGERHQLPFVDRSPVSAGPPRSGEHIDEGVEVRVPGELQEGTGGDAGVQQGHRCVGRAGAPIPTHLAGDDPHKASAIGCGQQGHLVGFEPLIGGGDHLLPGREVHPELDAMEQATGDDELLGRCLDVQDASAGGHPLRRSVGDETAPSLGVLVGEGPLHHVGHRLEPAVGVPGGPLGLTGGVVDLSHLIHVHEGVEVDQAHAGEGPAHREPLALEAARCGRHRPHRAFVGHCPVGGREFGQCRPVVNGHSRHGHLPSVGSIPRSTIRTSIPLRCHGAVRSRAR